MAQTDDEFTPPLEVKNDDFGENIVISGIAGLYPSANNVKKFEEMLYNKVNPINSEKPRCTYNYPEAAQYTGKVPGLYLFDAQFFNVHHRLGNTMDPMGRKILEQSYQAIYDAGISPEELNGKKVGVYIGSCFSKTEKSTFYKTNSMAGFGIAGCSKTMFANRISYWLNAKGPSMTVDDACCSSTAALELAYHAINRGDCESAIVGGANLCLHPQSSVHCGRIVKLSMDGKTKSFDANADGCAKSEAVNVFFLQKAKNALRIYAEIVHVKCEYTSVLEGELGPRYGFYRDPLDMTNFIEQFYKESKVSPQEVEYVEAFGSATPDADKTELEVIDQVFCKMQRKPLLVGSVISNIGYTEAATGISAITKVLLGYQNGKLAGNLNCDSPRQDVAGLRDGRIKIVTENQRFGRKYTAVNGLSISGLNSHVLLHGRYKPKDLNRYKSEIPHLVTLSARQDFAVENIISYLKSRPIDPEELALLHNIHQNRISGHLGRGFTLLDTDENGKTVSLCDKSSCFDDAKRPLWFVYSGMGSQWSGMGTQLMRIPIFASAIERCHRVLEPKGIDIVHIITSPDKTIFDNILNSFVGIAAVQIGLTDILRELGIFPDKIIGHSVGELGCAYADGCFTAEEMILSAYSRGLVSVQTPFIRGSMAAVGVGYQQISRMCPPEIEIACHNGPDSSTISGPAEVMKKFVAELTKKDIFTKEVPCSNIAYHSRYIAEAGPGLLKYLKEVITTPKLRSERWVSTSVPQDRWDEPTAKYSSAEYHTNNLLNSVLFEETSKLISSNAVLVEISPHGILQTILKRSLPETSKYIPLTRRGHPDNVIFLLEAIGNLYMEGYNPKVQELYPKVEFPVSTGTPMLSHLVEWAHHERWNLPVYVSANRKTTTLYRQVTSIYDDDHTFLKNHIIGEKNVYPLTGVLVAVWDTLAVVMNVERKQLSVQFKDVYVHSHFNIIEEKPIRLIVAIQRGTGKFEVRNENIIVASGYIHTDYEAVNIPYEEIKGDVLDSNDIYQFLHARGFNYLNDFRSIQNIDQSLTKGHIIWSNNWITFIDGLIQMNLLRRFEDTTSYPNYIKRLDIDVTQQTLSKTLRVNGSDVKTAVVSEMHNWSGCGGVVIHHMQYHDLPQAYEVALNALTFVPHFTINRMDEKTALCALLQMVAENLNKDVIHIVEVTDHSNLNSNIEKIKKIAQSTAGPKISFSIIQRDNILEEIKVDKTDIDLLLANNLSTDENMCKILHQVLRPNTFVMNKEVEIEETLNPRSTALYRNLSAHTVENVRWELSMWGPSDKATNTSSFTVVSASDLVSLVSSEPTLPPGQRILILSSFPPVPGLKNLVKEWRTQRNRKINLVIFNQQISEEQNLDQMSLSDLAVNILDYDIWGGEYFLPMQNDTVDEVEKALEIDELGDFDSLHWVKASESTNLGVPVKIHYAGVNEIDVKIKLNNSIYESENSHNLMIFDFSGKTERGIPVMGIAQEESIRSRVKAKPELLWPVPIHWSLEEAATVPLAYSMAFYCLSIKTRLHPGNRILVHGGSGALGQAVLSIALAYGCEVFTTVGDNKKKHFLCKLFPDLEKDHIINTRDGSFSDMILHKTRGLGCNIVIICCRGMRKNYTIKCCALSGIVVDASVNLNSGNLNTGVKNLAKSLSYVTLDFSSLFEPKATEELKQIQCMISEGIARGYVRPLTRVTYEPSEAPRAYRFLASNQYRGRILINMQKDIPCCQTKIECQPDLHYLLMSDDQMLGIQFAERLISRGARKLILHFMNQSNCLQFKLRSWRKQGIDVKIYDAMEFDSVMGNNRLLQNVEGVYYLGVPDALTDKINIQLERLNTLKLQLRTQINYFAVVSTDVDTVTKIASSQDKIHITRVVLPSKNNGTMKDAVNIIEEALSSNERVVLGTVSQVTPPSPLLKDIAQIADVEIPNGVSGEVTLRDLGLNPFQCEAVKKLLYINHNVSIDEKDIMSLDIDSIRGFANKKESMDVNDNEGGLSIFYSYFERDEMLATAPMLSLQTLVGDDTTNGDEFEVTQSFLCVIPGVESQHARFRDLCGHLKLTALVLQPQYDQSGTVQEMARGFAEIIMKATKLDKRFYLLGYERGVLVALEMAAILESRGGTGTVFCIGGTPEEVQGKFDEEIGHLNTEEALQTEVLRHMSILISDRKSTVLDAVLQKNITWDEKISSFLQMSSIGSSTEYAKGVIKSALTNILQVRSYVPDPKPLRSLVVFIRPQDVTSKTNTEAYSEQPVINYTLESSLKYACRDLLCSTIINRHLDEELLSKFKKQNLLETYDFEDTASMSNDDILLVRTSLD